MSCLRLRLLCNQDRSCRSLGLAGPDMARIIAAYIAHERKYSGRLPSERALPSHPDIHLRWKQIYCLFALLKRFSAEDEETRFVLYSDHLPPVIEDRLLDKHLERLGVEIYRGDHYWRPEHRSDKADFFMFDSMEQLAKTSSAGDQILLFGSQALALHPLALMFDLLSKRDILVAEASIGEISEEHARALRERMIELRKLLSIPIPSDAMLAINSAFVGFTHERLVSLLSRLQKLFPKNLLLALNGNDHFRTAGEMLAAILAQDGLYRSTLGDISQHAAAMPDDFAIARLADATIFLPGYGLEPDISKLFSSLIPDHLHEFDSISLDSVMQILKRENSPPPFSDRVRNWLPFRRGP